MAWNPNLFRWSRAGGAVLTRPRARPAPHLASDHVAEVGRLEQAQGALGHALAKALAREQLRLRLAGQVGDVEDVLDDQRVDDVLDHAHEVGVEPAELLGAVRSAAEEGV